MLKFTYIVTNALSCILKIIIVVSIELIHIDEHNSSLMALESIICKTLGLCVHM